MSRVKHIIAELEPNDVSVLRSFKRINGKNRFTVLESRGSLLPELITPMNKRRVWNDYAERGIILPDLEDVQRKGMEEDEVYLVHSSYYEQIAHNEDIYELLTFPGFMFDKNSSPKLARSFVDNDDPQLEKSAWWHDPSFALHLVSFRVANAFHYWRGRASDNALASSLLAWGSVSSFIGRRSYKGNDPLAHWQKEYTIFIKNGKIEHKPEGFQDA